MADIGKHISAAHDAGAKTIKAVGGAVPYAGRAAASISRATGISQDNIIFGIILLAFVVYITVEGELPAYLGFFILNGIRDGPLIPCLPRQRLQLARRGRLGYQG